MNYTGFNLVSMLQECLWYLDGRHAIIEHHSTPIPTAPSRFVGSKSHRNRNTGNVYLEICSIFYLRYKNPCLDYCKQNFGKDRNGRTFMMLPLASGLVHYCDYKMLNHASCAPVRSLADSVCVNYVKSCTKDRCLPHFDELNQHMKEKQPYEHVLLDPFAPDDPRERYDYLQSLERSDCKFSIVIVTHSLGSNAGNIHFA